MGVIYKITSPTGRVYIGQTINFLKRMGDYKRCVRYGSGVMVVNSLRKHGVDNHKFEVVEQVENGLLNEREIFWINELKTYWKDSPLGMNMTRGGESGSGPWKHDTERVKKWSEKIKGKGNPFYGKKHTEEFKKNKSKEVSEYNKKNGVQVPEWGVEKGRNVIRRPVVCYDSNGIFLKEFVSVTQAADYLCVDHGSVTMVCLGERTHANRYIFRYKTENYPLKIAVGELKKQTVKRPVLTLTPEYEIVCEYPSAKEVADFWGIPKTTINRAAMYNWLVPIRAGHVFIYKDLYEEILKNAS